MLVVARGRQAVLEVDGAAGAEVPLDRVVPTGVVVRVGSAHFFVRGGGCCEDMLVVVVTLRVFAIFLPRL